MKTDYQTADHATIAGAHLVCHESNGKIRPGDVPMREAVARGKLASTARKHSDWGEYRKALFNHFTESHNLNLTESQMDDIEFIVLKHFQP